MIAASTRPLTRRRLRSPRSAALARLAHLFDGVGTADWWRISAAAAFGFSNLGYYGQPLYSKSQRAENR